MENMEMVTIREQVKNFVDWHIELIAQIPEIVKYQTRLSFTIFSLLEKDNTVHIRSFMDLSFENSPSDFDMFSFFEEMRKKAEKPPSVVSGWWRVRQIGLYEPIKYWPEQRHFSEAWGIKNATLDRELERERLILRLRIERIRKAYSHLGAVAKLSETSRSLMRPKLLLQARAELDEAIRLIRRTAKCGTFDADNETLLKKDRRVH